MIIVSEGKHISTGKEVIERLEAGATLATTRDPFFTNKGPFTIGDIKSEIRQQMKEKGINDINQLNM